jgi:hypothetical protein
MTISTSSIDDTQQARVWHAYLDPLLAKQTAGQTIAFEDLESSWVASQQAITAELPAAPPQSDGKAPSLVSANKMVVIDSSQFINKTLELASCIPTQTTTQDNRVQKQQLRSLHDSLLTAYREAAHIALTEFAESVILPEVLVPSEGGDNHDKKNAESMEAYVDRIYESLTIPNWKITNTAQVVRLVLEKRAASEIFFNDDNEEGNDVSGASDDVVDEAVDEGADDEEEDAGDEEEETGMTDDTDGEEENDKEEEEENAARVEIPVTASLPTEGQPPPAVSSQAKKQQPLPKNKKQPNSRGNKKTEAIKKGRGGAKNNSGNNTKAPVRKKAGNNAKVQQPGANAKPGGANANNAKAQPPRSTRGRNKAGRGRARGGGGGGGVNQRGQAKQA